MSVESQIAQMVANKYPETVDAIISESFTWDRLNDLVFAVIKPDANDREIFKLSVDFVDSIKGSAETLAKRQLEKAA